MPAIDFTNNPRVSEFLEDLAKQAKGTARLYGGFLSTYYQNFLHPVLGLTID